MLIISVGDDENNRWTRNAKKQQQQQQRQKRTRGAETIMKGSELNDFVVPLS